MRGTVPAIAPRCTRSVCCLATSRRATLGAGLLTLGLLQRTPHAGAQPDSSTSSTNSPLTAPAPSPKQAQPTGIAFSYVPREVAAQLEQRDNNLAWKCQGKSMFDCDNELAEKAEAQMEEFRELFRDKE